MYVYPYGDSQQLNLDWIINKLKELENQSASAADLEEIANVFIALTHSSGTQYRRYDYCYYQGKLYRALNDNIGAFNASDWLEVRLGDDLSVLTRLINTAAIMDVRFDTSGTDGKLQQKYGASYHDIVAVDYTPVQNSKKPVSSGAVYDLNTAINHVEEQITVYIENGNTSSRAYGVGQYIIWKGDFYKVISAITSSGITFTPNTNIKTTNVGEELSAIREAVPITTFQNDWETNGECFYQIIRNVYHLHCSIRNGTNNAQIISFGASAAPLLTTYAIILSTSSINGYAQINTSGQVSVHNVSNTGSVFFDLFWKKA